MLDAKLIRSDLRSVVENLKQRGFDFPEDAYTTLEKKRKMLQIETEQLQNKRNTLSKQIGQAKAKQEAVDELMTQVSAFSSELDRLKAEYDTVQHELDNLLMTIPNVLHDSVPPGKDENDNVVIRQWGEKPSFDFVPKEHGELGEMMSKMDFQLASKITGSRFVVLSRELARLQRALTQFMLDLHSNEHGYSEMYVPYIVNADSLRGTSQLPKFLDDQFRLASDNDYFLIPTAEVPLTNLVRNQIVDESSLPLRFVTHTPCFRREAGSYGRDTKGMLRQHQFEKVELVIVCKPEDSDTWHEKLTSHAEKVLQLLDLPYQVSHLCGGDVGFAANRTYDLEVWLPGQGEYREISSCSHFDAFQARRMKARFKPKGSRQNEYLHTLNGSGLAVGRTLIAVMENYQNKDGSIDIPKVLIPYMDNLEKIKSLQSPIVE